MNVWDVVSAKVVAQTEGTTALATASHSMAASFGYKDGENIPLDLMLEQVKRIVDSTDLPVTADLEGGYGNAPETIRRAIGLGVVGANIEDQLKPIAEAAQQVEDIMKVAEQEGVDFVLNARTDAFSLNRKGDPAENLADRDRARQGLPRRGRPGGLRAGDAQRGRDPRAGRRLRAAEAHDDRHPRQPAARLAAGARRRADVVRPAVAERRPHRAPGAGRGGAPRRRYAGQPALPD